MTRDLGLPWTVAREAKAYPEGVGLRPERPAGPDLLALIDPERKDLFSPVRVFRALPVEVAAGAPPAQVTLADGTPLVVAAHPGSREAAGPGAGGPTVEAPQRGLVVM